MRDLLLRLALLVTLGVLVLGNAADAGRPTLDVRTTILDDDFPAGYQVAVADINGDGKPDIIGLGSTVAWLENPTWRKHPITADQTRGNIDLALHDIDGDGLLDIAVASDFALNDSTRGGTLSWFSRTADLSQPWTLHPIDAYPTTHRIRWADVDGTGHKVLISAPILGRGAKAPEYDQAPAPLFLYRIPANPFKDPWPRQIIDESHHVLHGLEILDFDGDGREEILTASFEGIFMVHAAGAGSDLKWSKTQLCAGEQETRPARGASEVHVGKLKGNRRFIAALEPWHGDEVAVYLPPLHAGELWHRRVIDSSFSEGHALAVMDMDGDGSEEIVAGFRGKKRGVVAYRATDESGGNWEKFVLDDGGIACQGFFLADLRGSGRMGIVGIGGATHNIKLYELR